MTKGTVKLPYVKGILEQLRKIFNYYQVRAAFRCGKRVKDIGNKTKSQLKGRKNMVIYEIPCICGAVYIGQTERAVEKRHQEHERDLRLTRDDLESERGEASAERRIASSRLVQHCVRGCGHNPDWENVKVLETDPGWTTRRLRETYITMRKQHEGKEIINEVDIQIDESWKQTLEYMWDKEMDNRR